MTRTMWRIVKKKFATTAFTGEGARLFGGRWNRAGSRVVYTAGTPALAILELAVHLEQSAVLAKYVLIPVTVPGELIEETTADQLPRRWNAVPATRATAAFGDRWLREGRSAVLGVPSVVSPMDRNYLLNPAHPRFARIQIGKPQPCRIDPRLRR